MELLMDCLTDSVKLLPFLFLSYLAVEYIEHRMSERTKHMIYRAGAAGPVFGGILGIIPQCGFAAAAAGLFAGGVVSPGTVLAVFLSASDEMLPIMLSEGVDAGTVARILMIKALTGITAGLLLDAAARKVGWRRAVLRVRPQKIQTRQLKKERTQWKKSRAGIRTMQLTDDTAVHSVMHAGQVTPVVQAASICEHDHCNCEEESIWKSALKHTASITAFIFLFSLCLGFLMEHVEITSVSQILGNIPALEEGLMALVGMIPNCAASVLVTQLYLQELIRSGSLFSGLLCGAGAGLLVLFRENRSRKENVVLLAALYISGVTAGLLIGLWY